MPTDTLVLALPFISGITYAIAALIIKRALHEGYDALRASVLLNLAMGVVAIGFLFFDGTPAQDARWYMPLLAALAYTLGATLNTFALLKGDVSVATPLLGTKVLFVAFFAVVVNGIPVPPALWGAGALVVLGLFLLRGDGTKRHHHFGLTVVLALSSAASFALCDAFFQAYATLWGLNRFIPMVFGAVAVLSLGLLPFCPKRETPPAARTRRSLLTAAFLNAVQSMGIAFCLSVWIGGATTINILYSSRGLWSVALVWAVGHWFANTERSMGWRVMAMRLAGAVVLTAAIVIALLYGRPA